MQEQVERSLELIIVGNFFDAGQVRPMGQLMTIAQTYNDAWLDHTIRRSEDFPKALNADSDLPLVPSQAEQSIDS